MSFLQAVDSSLQMLAFELTFEDKSQLLKGYIPYTIYVVLHLLSS